MRKFPIKSLPIAIMLILQACYGSHDMNSISVIERSFMNPPDSVRIAAYWYWINGNISPEGAVKDLHAMKKAGITRVHIGIIGLDGVPYGPVKYDSDVWWETIHRALRTAGELDIEVGMFNCPGWSQSGGPWVKPEQSMRRIMFTDTVVDVTGHIDLNLPAITGNCGDVAVIAYPAFKMDGSSRTWDLTKKAGAPLSDTLKLYRPETIRSLEVKTSAPVRMHASIKAKINDRWTELKQFDIDRSNPELIVGFEPYAPIFISFPETKTDELLFETTDVGSGHITVTVSELPKVERAMEKQLAKMCQTPLPMWDYYMWDKEPEYNSTEWFVNPENVVNITDCLNGNRLSCKLPEGKWIISRYAMVPTGVTNSPASAEATGLEIDKLNRTHLQAHFDAYIGEILKRIPANDRRTFRILVEDSYETGGQNWTDAFAEKFQERYGYSPYPYLPVMQGIPVGNNEMSSRFLWDLRRFVADLIATEYVGGLTEIANKNGLTTWLENYGHWGFPSEFLLYGSMSDEIAGEFWSEGTLGDIENRAASSCGHIYGKNKIWAESCTAGGYAFTRYPHMMKQRVDRFFTEGINASLLHLYIHQDSTSEEPGLSAPFGNEFNRKNTWFEHLDLFTDYLRRCNFVLQQGRYVADVAYFIGEDTPKMTGICNPALPDGYSFDYINADVLRNHSKVKNGRLVLDSGMEYQVLVLPYQKTMRPELLQTIQKLTHDGLTVVGPAPEFSPSLENYPEADAMVRQLAASLWPGPAKFAARGKGKIWNKGVTLAEVFEELQATPDLHVMKGETMPGFIHRTLDDAEIYFVANPTDSMISIHPTFRVMSDYQAQRWNATNGEIRPVTQVTPVSGGLEMPLQLEPLESTFIVFRKDVKGPVATDGSKTTYETLADLTGHPWQIKFEERRGGPAAPLLTESLFDWTTHHDTNIANYSGKATYTTSVYIDSIPDGNLMLELGNVMVMAKVKVNGIYAGGVWTNPYRIDISSMVNKGNNTIEVEVINNWRNRMIADAALPEETRLTHSNIQVVYANDTPQPSGLIGPVKILLIK